MRSQVRGVFTSRTFIPPFTPCLNMQCPLDRVPRPLRGEYIYVLLSSRTEYACVDTPRAHSLNTQGAWSIDRQFVLTGVSAAPAPVCAAPSHCEMGSGEKAQYSWLLWSWVCCTAMYWLPPADTVTCTGCGFSSSSGSGSASGFGSGSSDALCAAPHPQVHEI